MYRMDPGSGWLVGGWFGWLVGMALVALVVGLLVLAIAWPIYHLTRRTFAPGHRDEGAGPAPQPGRPAVDPALDELRLRFARGEIDEAEFEARRRALRA
jgi:putative membrane protein